MSEFNYIKKNLENGKYICLSTTQLIIISEMIQNVKFSKEQQRQIFEILISQNLFLFVFARRNDLTEDQFQRIYSIAGHIEKVQLVKNENTPFFILDQIFYNDLHDLEIKAAFETNVNFGKFMKYRAS